MVAHIEQEVVGLVDTNSRNAAGRSEVLAEVDCAEQEMKRRLASVALAAAGSAAWSDQVCTRPTLKSVAGTDESLLAGKLAVFRASPVCVRCALADGLQRAPKPGDDLVGSCVANTTSRDRLYVETDGCAVTTDR